MEADVPQDVGPWGGKTGRSWDDGTFKAITQIDVHVGKGIVRGLQIYYQDENNKLVEANKRGGGKDVETIVRVSN